MELTPDQSSLLELLAPGDYSFAQLSLAQQATLADVLRPQGTFTDDQRALMQNWWLVTTEAQLATCNETLTGTGLAIGAIADGDRLLLPAHLLTDCMRPGDNYHAIAPVLSTLAIARIELELA